MGELLEVIKAGVIEIPVHRESSPDGHIWYQFKIQRKHRNKAGETERHPNFSASEIGDVLCAVQAASLKYRIRPDDRESAAGFITTSGKINIGEREAGK